MRKHPNEQCAVCTRSAPGCRPGNCPVMLTGKYSRKKCKGCGGMAEGCAPGVNCPLEDPATATTQNAPAQGPGDRQEASGPKVDQDTHPGPAARKRGQRFGPVPRVVQVRSCDQEQMHRQYIQEAMTTDPAGLLGEVLMHNAMEHPGRTSLVSMWTRCPDGDHWELAVDLWQHCSADMTLEDTDGKLCGMPPAPFEAPAEDTPVASPAITATRYTFTVHAGDDAIAASDQRHVETNKPTAIMAALLAEYAVKPGMTWAVACLDLHEHPCRPLCCVYLKPMVVKLGQEAAAHGQE